MKENGGVTRIGKSVVLLSNVMLDLALYCVVRRVDELAP